MNFTTKRDGSKVEAFKWTDGPDQKSEPDWIVEKLRNREALISNESEPVVTMTFRSGQIAKLGDWIVRDAAGRVFPCRQENFWGHYETVH
jgi:hypothetical protein